MEEEMNVFTTTNLKFLCEANINIPKNTIKELPSTKKIIEAKIEYGKINIYKNEIKLETTITDFKNIFAELIDGFYTIDFWSENFLESIIKENYASELKIEKVIASNDKKGYILEAIISFPKNSQFYKEWNDERTRKGEIFMRQLSNF